MVENGEQGRDLQPMDRVECLRLLEAEDVGRLAIVQGSTPVIFPVNYVLDGESIVFRTAPGAKLAFGPHALVAFEIDYLSREDRSGWSVVVTGQLDELTDDDELERIRRLPLEPWAGGVRDHWMRLVPGIITGRRLGGPPDAFPSNP
jgi:nitroimidazol reductase NimA-like FMN-containing flavoprotein (pyridoxamine 5'-phosphate oxidase superfamily)